jgi:PAS domain S-box-containing protein
MVHPVSSPGSADITAGSHNAEEYQNTEDALKAAGAYNRSLIETSLDPLVTIGPDGKITDVNSATEAVTGFNRNELIGTDFDEYFTEPKKAREGYKQVFEKGFVRDYPLEIRHRSGSITPVLYNASVFRDNNGNVIGVFAAARDITELKKAEEAVKEAGAYNRSLIEVSPDPLVTIGPDGKITDVNSATEAVTGFNRNELIGTDFADYFTEPDKAREGYKQVFEKGFVRDYPLEIRHRNGSIISVLYNASIYRDKNWDVVGVFAAARDITKRKKAEAELNKYREHLEELVRERTSELEKEIDIRKKIELALRESKESFRLITQTTPVQISINRVSDGTILFTNPAYDQAYGFSEGELLGRKTEELYWNPADRAVILGIFKKQGFVQNDEVRVKQKDGKPLWLSVSVQPFSFAGEETYLTASIDITDRKKTEELIQQQVEYTMSLINKLPGLFYAIDDNANLIQTNDKFSEVSGYSSDEIKKMHGMDFFAGEDKRLIEARIREVFEKGESTAEADFISRDGKAIPYYFTGSRIMKDGKPILIGMGVDITESKHREQIIEASLKEKEVLLREIHHRVKNNLQLISSILNLQSNYIKDKKALEAFRESQNRIRSMALIHERLYRSSYLSNINIKEYINEITANLFSSYSYESKKIKLNINAADLNLEVDKCIAIGLILNELISNSLKHGFPEEAKGEININLYPGKDQRLTLIFSDNGRGMPKDFDFRSTETLGLQLIMSLVEQHNGLIELDNTKGVKFTITIKI